MRTLTPRSARARECLDHRPARKDIGGKVDFPLRGLDQRDVHVFEVFGGRVVDCRQSAGRHTANSAERNLTAVMAVLNPAVRVKSRIHPDVERVTDFSRLAGHCGFGRGLVLPTHP
jgi:hypothetical protein